MPSAPPEGWPRLSSAIFYEDATAAISFLERAFGFETRMKVEGPEGTVEHSELVYNGALVMVATAAERPPRPPFRSPRAAGCVTSGFYMYVEDIDAHFEVARAAGAEILVEPATKPYGDRTYEVLDCEGHWWSFGERVDQEAWERATEAENQA